MAVPAEIRAVPRLVNTIVDDVGADAQESMQPNLSGICSPTDWESLS